ncbi:MAG: hypothetical protein QW666_00645 [Candidatus Woesearchaeota archaeon]
MQKKRAQVTIFIIIGIILLLSILLVVYITTREIAQPVEEAIIVPEDVKPVHEFITNCLQQTAKRGAALLGQQGGYIFMPAAISKTPSSHIALDPYGIFMIPYWYFEGEDRTPSIEFMQNELKKYIYDNIRTCTGNFEEFRKQYDIQEKGEIIPAVTFTERDVVIKLKWPLELTALGKTTRIEDYATRLQARIKQAWEVANRIMKTENQDTFFENLTIDLYSMDPEIPTDDLRFECMTRKWHLDDLKKRLQTVLYYNLPFVRVENTQYIPFAEKARTYNALRKERERIFKDLSAGKEIEMPEEAPVDAFQYFRMTMHTGQPKTDLRASFDYLPSWQMRFNGKPNTGGWLKSNMGRGGKYLNFFCMNQWHFTYDIIYPVRATIKDDDAYSGEGYIFQMAFPVIINSNKPERVFFGIKQFQPPSFGIDFCQELGDKEVEIRATGFTEASMFETELDDVNITLKCYHEECLLGTTKADDGYYRLRTRVPSRCANPAIIATKEGYLSNKGVLTGDMLTIPMKKLKKLDYKVMVYPYNSYSGTFNTPRELKKDEEALISISARNITFDQLKSYPAKTNTMELIEETTVYSIDIMLSRLNNQIGGYTNNNMTIKYSDIIDADTVVFNVMEYIPMPLSEDLKMKMYETLYAETQAEALKPTFEMK